MEEKIRSFISEIDKKHKNNRAKEDREKLCSLLEMIESGDINVEEIRVEYLEFETYTDYLTKCQSNKRRIKTKNIKCKTCNGIMIKTENTAICLNCNIEIEHKEKSTTNNTHSHFKRSIENYTGESTIPRYIIALIPYIAEWLKDLKYYKRMIAIFQPTRSSQLYESISDKEYLETINGFSNDNIPNIQIFKYLMFYFYNYLVTTAPNSSYYSKDTANFYISQVKFEIDYSTIKYFPFLYNYGQNYYKLMIRIFNARKLDLTPSDKNLIISIFISYRKFQTIYETEFLNGDKPNSNLFFVVFKNILNLPYFEGKYHYIIPYLAKAKPSTEALIRNKWLTFLDIDDKMKEYTVPPSEDGHIEDEQ